MGFFSRFSKKPPPPTPEATEDDAPEIPSAVARLALLGHEGGPSADEAAALFASLRTSPDEGRAVQVLVDQAERIQIPDAVAIPLCSALSDRGRPEVALRILERSTSSSALVLRADLASFLGDVPLALSLIERVLLRNIDEPGAKERLARWRAEIGLAAPKKAVHAGATVVTRDTDAPFELIREIARGGAGAVYEAIDRELDRHVALKIYHDSQSDRAQLAHEAKVATQMAGRGVIRVFDVDLEHGWLALEWAENRALRDAIHAKQIALLSPLERWALPLAETLGRIHREAWVHYDLKPANVLFSRDARPILTDFGIARPVGAEGGPGSLGYVSPERLKGARASTKDDIFGFGRIVEDVADALGSEIPSGWRALASVCTGPEAHRPTDGNALVTRIKVEIGQ